MPPPTPPHLRSRDPSPPLTWGDAPSDPTAAPPSGAPHRPTRRPLRSRRRLRYDVVSDARPRRYASVSGMILQIRVPPALAAQIEAAAALDHLSVSGWCASALAAKVGSPPPVVRRRKGDPAPRKRGSAERATSGPEPAVETPASTVALGALAAKVEARTAQKLRHDLRPMTPGGTIRSCFACGAGEMSAAVRSGAPCPGSAS